MPITPQLLLKLNSLLQTMAFITNSGAFVDGKKREEKKSREKEKTKEKINFSRDFLFYQEKLAIFAGFFTLSASSNQSA